MSAPGSPGSPAAPGGTPYASRGGLKLAHALHAFAIDPRGLVCADMGCSTGGFTDCLLRAGAARVYAIDTAYGQLAWTLRNDPRVVVLERTNALHAAPLELVGLVVADMGWTPQRLVVPAAGRWLAPGGRLVTLIKPHYEVKDRAPRELPRGGVLDEATAGRVAEETSVLIGALGARVLALTPSPILGGAGAPGERGRGNIEYLALIEPAPDAPLKGSPPPEPTLRPPHA